MLVLRIPFRRFRDWKDIYVVGSYFVWSPLCQSTSFSSVLVNYSGIMTRTSVNVAWVNIVGYALPSSRSKLRKYWGTTSSVSLLLIGLEWFFRRFSHSLNRWLWLLRWELVFVTRCCFWQWLRCDLEVGWWCLKCSTDRPIVVTMVSVVVCCLNFRRRMPQVWFVDVFFCWFRRLQSPWLQWTGCAKTSTGTCS